ncbi:DegT/DnrJ/EryC1/StrS family aminotransferase [Geodermatophilus nigrescens]|uniref:Perosamine synthetase n=1 Tax=Geodermatophilus nigrescens TaxID=1070870 RepID=A0A1M5E475_9ACTN|nr:DegT/DnrJ/EryC1/StrS family aminotransferase [Geodermatophilus nigrescens]SHF74049.1 perosamine synthetase [Geodermatophilus nigrescens]
MTALDAPALPVIPVMKPWLGEEEAAAAAEAVASGWVAQGPRVRAFEEAFARRVGAAEAVAVSNCTTALHLALHLLGVGPGDDVVVPSFSFIATANAVRHVGAQPVFADVDLVTGNLTPGTVEAALTPRTRAVVVVHQAGVPADTAALGALLEPRGIPVVEDAACAIGSTLFGRPVGAGAQLAAFSFHPRKLVTTGEGGMLVTPSADVAARARRLREHGMSVSAADRHASGSVAPEQYLEPGFNFRMTDVQAAIGLVQLTRLDAMVARRRELAARYRALLADLPGLRLVDDPSWGTTNVQSCWLLLPEDAPVGRDAVLARMSAAGVSGRRGIMAAHLEPAYADRPRVSLPATERLTADSLVLPLFHQMTEGEQDRVVDALRAALVP